MIEVTYQNRYCLEVLIRFSSAILYTPIPLQMNDQQGKRKGIKVGVQSAARGFLYSPGASKSFGNQKIG